MPVRAAIFTINIKPEIMNSAYVRIMSLSVIMATVFACSKNSHNNSQSCNVTYTDATPLSADGSVQYLAGVTGGATISSISFLDSAGTTTVKNPTLPFTRNVNLKQGAAATITAQGSASGSGAQINISIVDEGVQGGTSCP